MITMTTYANTIGAERTTQSIVIRQLPFLPNCSTMRRTWGVIILNPSHWFRSIEHAGMRHDTFEGAMSAAEELATWSKIPFTGVITD